MNSARQIFLKAGSAMGLPFLLLVATLVHYSALQAKEDAVLTFQEIESSCINLAHYNAQANQLTVRYVDQEANQFYRYSKVPVKVWKKIGALNDRGGVGNYFVSTVQQHPEKYPFEIISLPRFNVIPQKKKAGDSK